MNWRLHWWMLKAEWRFHRGRTLSSVLAIAMGVGLGLAVEAINASALSQYETSLKVVGGAADSSVVSIAAGGLPITVLTELERDPAVETASPVIDMEIDRSNGPAYRVIGIDPLTAGKALPQLLVGAREHGNDAHPDVLRLFSDHTVLVSKTLADELHLHVNDRTIFPSQLDRTPLSVVGELAGAPPGVRWLLMDVSTAQWHFSGQDRIQRIEIRLTRRDDKAAFQARWAQKLPANARFRESSDLQLAAQTSSRAYRVNLELVALLALVTGAFLVYANVVLSVARRQVQFAILGMLGMSLSAKRVQTFLETTLTGLLGSALGTAIGLGTAALALRVQGEDLGGGYFRDGAPELHVPWSEVVLFFLLGLSAALIAGVIAQRAMSTEPVRSLRSHALLNRRSASSNANRWGAAMLCAAVGFANTPPIWGLPIGGYLAMAAMLTGTTLLLPSLCRLTPTPGRRAQRQIPMYLALQRLKAQPSASALTIGGLVAAVGLVVSMLVMVSSFRSSVETWLSQVLTADLYVRLASPRSFDAEVQNRILSIQGVASADFQQWIPTALAADRPPVTLIVRPINSYTAAARLALIAETAPPKDGTVAVWVSEPLALFYHLKPGAHFKLPISGQAADVTVQGIWRDYARQFGALVIDTQDYQRLGGSSAPGMVSLSLARGASASAVADAVLHVAGPVAEGASVTTPSGLKRTSLVLFDRSFALTYALEVAALGIALAGMAATFSAMALARMGEFGVLRHLGVSGRQALALLATEGAVLGLMGAGMGIALGLGMSAVLVNVVNPQSFHWTMTWTVPAPSLAGVALLVVLGAATTTTLSGIRLLSRPALRAVHDD